MKDLLAGQPVEIAEDRAAALKTAFLRYHLRKVLFLTAVGAGIVLMVGVAASFGSYELPDRKSVV